MMKRRKPRIPAHYRHIVDRIEDTARDVKNMSDKELRDRTSSMKAAIAAGRSLEELLPEAFAVFSEAAWRVLGMRPYRVQLMAAVALHEGKIIDMATGEGKTLTAAIPLYLNALTGKKVILVTVNNYLARRDGEEMGRIFSFLGLTTGIAVYEDPNRRYEAKEKREIYSKDIIYTTSGGLTFDYLSENLGSSVEDRFLPEFYYVIIDEADAVLLDAAVMPLVISGAARLQSNLYGVADAFVTILEEGVHFVEEEGRVYLTEEGADLAERYFRVEDLYDGTNLALERHIQLALQARCLYKENVQYVVRDGKIVLLDNSSGRMLDNTKLNAGQHQALEAKEGVELTRESRAMASITYQHFYDLFPKVAGMSGTAALDASEFASVYKMRLEVIPPNRPMIRRDLPDRCFRTREEQLRSVIKEIRKLHTIGRPVLVITESINLARQCSEELLRAQVPHSLLTAFNLPREAEIIAAAGVEYTVTVATSIAGRGTDIRITERAKELGGLAVIGVGRMSSRKLEAQARGRAGRQGDPGTSCFFVSMEDKIVEDAWPERKDKNRHFRMDRLRNVRRFLRNTQKKIERGSRGSRKNTMELAVSILIQRELLYETRRKLIDGEAIPEETVMKILREVVDGCLGDGEAELTDETVMGFIFSHVSYRADWIREKRLPAKAARDYTFALASQVYHRKLASLPNDELRSVFVRKMLLRAIDDEWIDQIDYMQQLRIIVGGRRFAQRNEIYEYLTESHDSYMNMRTRVHEKMMKMLLLSDFSVDEEGSIHIITP